MIRQGNYMMKYFFDILLIGGVSDKSPSRIMGEVLQELHCVLHDIRDNDGKQSVGITFPGYNKTLGDELRLFSNEETLLNNTAQKLKNRLRNIPVMFRPVCAVPSRINGHVVVYRHQTKTTIVKGKPHPPFSYICSGSSNKEFLLYIIQEDIDESEDSKFQFNTYGLSSKSQRVPLPVF